MTSLLPVLFLFLAWPAGTGAEEELLMPFMEHLDPARLVTLRWGFDEAQGTIAFRLTIRTTGWVGFGFSPNGGMAGADIVIGGTGPNGTYFTDRHATGPSLPLVDKQQSYTLLSLTEADGQTTMTFQRAIHLCDEDDFHITASPIKLIYAYGATDDIKYHHTRRGTKQVNLLKYMPSANLTDANYFKVTMDNVPIPASHTYYHCKIMKLPRLNVKHHMFRIEADIEHLDIVHHMLLYGCPSSVTKASDKSCDNEGMEPCLNVIAVWGIGGGPFELPENAGIPIGGEGRDIFYLLEIHYNNPTEIAGLRDSSGFKMYYTKELRQHDVGVLATGIAIESIYAIPPHANDFHSYGVCNTSHFPKYVDGPVPDFKVFSVFLHTHLAGRKVRVGLFRNGHQVDFLGVNENYDFSKQDSTYLGNVKTIKPGDEIVVECTYSTANRTGFTKMGFATTDEMCLAFIYYYPAIDVTFCWSLPDIPGTEENYPPQSMTQADIAQYEDSLKHLPQIQIIADDHGNFSLYPQGMIMHMVETPVSCRTAPVTTSIYNLAPRGLSTSWGLTSTGSILLLLLWMAVF